MKKTKIFFLLLTSIIVIACSTVKITGRKQLNAVPSSFILSASFAQYNDFIKQHQLSTDNVQIQKVKKVADKLIEAVNKYYTKHNWQDDLRKYQWEVNLVKDKQLNAFCMPGGKIVYYDGLLKVTTDDAEIAAVMGHEIAHALANHGSERLTMSFGQQLGAVLTALATNKATPEQKTIWMAAYGYGTQLGVMLPYSRKHESEADKIGQIMMAIAGYNPDKAVNVWVKMSKMGGNQPPEFLSTHPSHETRMKNLKKWAPEAKKIAAEYGVKF